MKLIHLSDLHIGKRVNEFSMIEDQSYILEQILAIIKEQAPQAVLIAGDVYDKTIPSCEAVSLLDDFLVKLSKLNVQVFIIGGNHDSQERLSFGSRLIEESGIHISSAYSGKVEPYTLTDEYGEVRIYPLPFVKPSNVQAITQRKIDSYTEAIKVAIDEMEIDESKRNVLITHQFVTGAERSESEECSVGGTDNVDASVFSPFDYVALGHIHKPQSCGASKIRYCGTPLKYSFSEAKDKKSVSVALLGKKGELHIDEVPLVPLHDMVKIRGTYEELMKKDFYEGTTLKTDYVHITLTNEEDVVDAMGTLRIIYKNLMKIEYDNQRTRLDAEIDGANDVDKKSPLELFEELYLLQNNKEMSKEQRELSRKLIEKIWEDKV